MSKAKVGTTETPVCLVESAGKGKGGGKVAKDKRPASKCGTVRSYNEGCRGEACVLAMRDDRRERAAEDG